MHKKLGVLREVPGRDTSSGIPSRIVLPQPLRISGYIVGDAWAVRKNSEYITVHQYDAPGRSVQIYVQAPLYHGVVSQKTEFRRLLTPPGRNPQRTFLLYLRTSFVARLKSLSIAEANELLSSRVELFKAFETKRYAR